MSNFRITYLKTIALIMFIVITLRLIYLTTGNDNVTRADIITITRTPLSFVRLQEHLKELEGMSENIEEHSLKDIKNAISQTTILISSANTELKTQYQSWEDLQSTYMNDAKKLDQLKANLNKTQEISQFELTRIKEAMDSAEEESVSDTITNNLASFFWGIISSLVATGILGSFRKKHKKDTPI